MRYAIAFLLFGVISVVSGVRLGGAAWLLAWPGVSFLLVGLAYALREPRLFGKRQDGTTAWWAAVLLLPYLVLVHMVWRLQRSMSRENGADEIVPGFWVGRRPLRGEVPQEVGMIVDLTCEFAGAKEVRGARTYVCVPMLDGIACEEACLAEVVDKVARFSGSVYVHCAQGHGRSAMLAAAVLVARGHAKDVDAAVSMLVARRSGIALSAGQRDLLERVVSEKRKM